VLKAVVDGAVKGGGRCTWLYGRLRERLNGVEGAALRWEGALFTLMLG